MSTWFFESKFAKIPSVWALLFADTIARILATFHSPLKIMSTWFWVESQNSPKYQVYSLTFCSYNCTYFGHFSLSTQNHVPPDFEWRVKIRQNTNFVQKVSLYTFAQNSMILVDFSLFIQNHVHMIFGQNSPKYQKYSLTFCSKLHDFGHFSLSTQNQCTWFLVKIRQNTKCIALLFADTIARILATFHSPLKNHVDQILSWEPKFAKIPSV